MVLTVEGNQALTKCLTGKELHFTRVAMGDGVLADDQNIKELTDLISPQMELPIVSNKITGKGTTIMETQLKNAELAVGFRAREVGIFAIDPDTLTKTVDADGNTVYDGTEILYAVRNTGDYSDFIPAGGAGDNINILYDVITVIGQAENITVNITEGVGEMTRAEFAEHVTDANPHPSAPHLSGTVKEANMVLVKNAEETNFHGMSIDDARVMLLGGEVSTLGNLSTRIRQAEIEVSNLALSMVAAGDIPNSNLLIAEDFVDPDMVDKFSVKVVSMAAGDDSIDIETASGIIAGSWYWITDGINQEYIQIASVIKNGNVYRVLAKEPLRKTYDLSSCFLYRTTALLLTGAAEGAGDRKGFAWKPEREWTGTGTDIRETVPLNTTQGNADRFESSGVSYTASGLVALALS